MKRISALIGLILLSISAHASDWKTSDYGHIAFLKAEADGTTIVQLNISNITGTCPAQQFTGDSWAVKGDGSNNGMLTVYAIAAEHQHMVSQVLLAYSMDRKVRFLVNDNATDYPRISGSVANMCQVQRVIMNRHDS